LEPKSRLKIAFTVIGVALASLAIFGTALSLFALLATHRRPFHVAIGPPPPITAENIPIPLETWTVHGKGALPEIHVPFQLSSSGNIVITARINGKLVRCWIDTGCSDILWDSKLALTNRRTGLQTSAHDGGNHTVGLQEAILDRVEIGGLKLRQMPSEAVVSEASQMNSVIILGNSVFSHTVLTIDYAKRELVIRSSSPKQKLLAQRDGDHILDFSWRVPNARGRFGSPYIRGSVMSLPANIMVDTGWGGGGPTLALSRIFYDRVLPNLKRSRNKTGQAVGGWTFGTSQITTLSRISWSFGGIEMTSSACILEGIPPEEQAILGYDILRHFKTTIDYPHQKIRFQPN